MHPFGKVDVAWQGHMLLCAVHGERQQWVGEKSKPGAGSPRTGTQFGEIPPIVLRLALSPGKGANNLLPGRDLQGCPHRIQYAAPSWWKWEGFDRIELEIMFIFPPLFFNPVSPGESIKTASEEQKDKERQEENRSLIYLQLCKCSISHLFVC